MTEIVATTEGQALNPITGEVVDLRHHSSEELVRQISYIQDGREKIKDYESAISDELIRRMDQAAFWTMREGDHEVTAPSPVAGTIEYLPDVLEEVLRDLSDDGKIAATATSGALKRSVTVEYEVPLYANLDEIREWLLGVSLRFRETPLETKGAQGHRKASLSGIRALEKVPGVKEALDGAAVAVKPPRRKVSVKRKP